MSPVAVDTDPTDFRTHLAQINELVCGANLSEWIIENVFSYATKLVTLVAEESSILQNSCGLTSHERFSSGPLTNILVDDRFFDKLLVWVEGRPCVDTDTNARLLDHQRTHLLLLFENLITRSHQHLLLHETILRPLEQFIYKLSTNLRPPYESTYARTLYELCVLLYRDTSLLNRFREVSDELFEEPHMLFSLLVPLVHRGDVVGNFAKDALLLILALSKSDEPLATYLAFQSNFCPVLASSLSGLYSTLPKRLVPRHDLCPTDMNSPGGPVTMKTPAYLARNSSAPCVVELPVGGAAWHQLSEAEWSQSTDLRQILHTLDFCNLVVKIAHPNIRDQLLYFINTAFLVPVLGSALHQSALNEVVAATAYLELFLRRLTEPLLIKLFLRFIMTGSHDSSLIITSLINRLNANATLGMVTLSLFRTILSFHCEDVMYDLVFRHLEHLHHLECTRLPASSADRDVRPGRTRWPTPASRKPSASSVHPSLSSLAVDLVRSADRFLGLASESATDTEHCRTLSAECFHCIRAAEDKSGSNSAIINGNFVATAQRPSDAAGSHCACQCPHLLPESPNIFLYLKSAERRIQRRRSACRFWSSNYFPLATSCDPPFLFGRTDERPLSRGEEVYRMLIDGTKHAAGFSSKAPNLEATDVYQPVPLSLSSRTQSSSLYQLNFIQDLSDEEPECSSAVAPSVGIPIAPLTTSLSRSSGSLDPLDPCAATDSPSRQTPDSSSYSEEKCTCTLEVPQFNSSSNASGTVAPQHETDEFRAFLTLLDAVESPWKCFKHFGYLPSSTTWPPFGDVYFEELDSLHACLFSAPVSKGTQLVDKFQRTSCVQPSIPMCTPQSPLSTSHLRPIHRGSIKRTIPQLPIAGGIGPFLSILLNRLSTLHTNCLFTNLLLTDLIASLAAYSCPLLYTFLLNSVGLCLRPNVNSLYKVLRQVKSQLSAGAASVESWHSLIYRARLYLHSGLLYSTDTVVDPRFYSTDDQEASLCHSPLASSSPRNSSRGSPSVYQSVMRPLHEVRTVWLPLPSESVQQGDADPFRSRTSASPRSLESRTPSTRSSLGTSPATPLFPVQLSMPRDSHQPNRCSSLTPSSLRPAPFWNLAVNLNRTPSTSKQTSPLRSQSSRPLSAVRKRFLRHADRLVHRSTSSDRGDRDPAQSDLNTRTRNLVFGAIIFDEFCTELAALSYLHSMHTEVFCAFPSSTESCGSKG